MDRLEPFKEFLIIGLAAIAFIIMAKAAASGLPEGGISGAVKTVVMGV